MQINTTSDALDNLNKKLGGADIEIEPSTNKVDALKKIYKTLGGTDDVKGLSTVYQVLEKITEVAEGGGGGGGSLPTPSAQNVGAALAVVKSVSAGATIVPEQTVTTDNGQATTVGYDTSLFTEGTPVIAVINGAEYTGVVEMDGDVPFVSLASLYGFEINEDDAIRFYCDEDNTFVVQLNIPETTYGYGLDEYPGYDIVISTTNLDNTLSHYTPLKWDYATIHNKVLNGEVVTGILCCHYNYDERVDGDTNIDQVYLGIINIYSYSGEMAFYTIPGKRVVAFTFNPDTGEWLTVTKSTWS